MLEVTLFANTALFVLHNVLNGIEGLLLCAIIKLSTPLHRPLVWVALPLKGAFQERRGYVALSRCVQVPSVHHSRVRGMADFELPATFPRRHGRL